MDAEIRTFDDYLTATAKLLVLADLEIMYVKNLQTGVLVANNVRRTQQRRHSLTGAFLSQVLLASPSLIEADFICTEAIMYRDSNWHVTDSAASHHSRV